MTKQVTSDDVCRMMNAAAGRVRSQQKELSDLDSVAGDGDHGATMLRVVDCLQHAFGKNPAPDLKQSFYNAGWEVMGADGGASTALLGVFFLGVSDGIPAGSISLDCQTLAAAFQSGLSALQHQTKAQPGDKTMVDALAPAIRAMLDASQSGLDIDRLLEQAADAAHRGALSTMNMTARYGRARLVGDRTLGHQDAGAASIALMFEGFAQSVGALKGDSKNG